MSVDVIGRYNKVKAGRGAVQKYLRYCLAASEAPINPVRKHMVPHMYISLSHTHTHTHAFSLSLSNLTTVESSSTEG